MQNGDKMAPSGFAHRTAVQSQSVSEVDPAVTYSTTTDRADTSEQLISVHCLDRRHNDQLREVLVVPHLRNRALPPAPPPQPAPTPPGCPVDA